MRTMNLVVFGLALVGLLIGSTAEARRVLHGMKGRTSVNRYLEQRGHSTNVQVNAVGLSSSRKSIHYAVTNKSTHQTRILTQHRRTGKMSQFAQTKLRSGGEARGLANQQLRRERVNPGTFSGVDSRLPTRQGHVIGSATDRNEKVVVPFNKRFAPKQFDNHKRVRTASVARAAAPQLNSFAQTLR